MVLEHDAWPVIRVANRHVDLASAGDNRFRAHYLMVFRAVRKRSNAAFLAG